MMPRLACITAMLALGALGSQVHAQPTQSRKQAILEAKRLARSESVDKLAWRKSLDKRIGKPETPPVNVFNTWTHEMLAFDAGDTQPPPPEVVNKFLRCHFTNAPTEMASELFPVLLQAAKKFRVRRVDVVSGFRDPKYNLVIRKKGHQVARESQHTEGHAVDFRLPGIRIDALHKWARSLHLGGVGFYKSSAFIHVDVGRVRYWNGT